MVKANKEMARAARIKEAVKAEKEERATSDQQKLLEVKRVKDREAKKNRRVKFQLQKDSISQLQA